jgi:hypothetical protein
MQTFKMFLEAAIVKYKSSVAATGPVDNEKVLKMLNSDYSDAWLAFTENDHALYRGMKMNNEVAIIAQPSTGERRSENTFNFYTLFIDENKYWEGFPKRSKSLICSTNIERAREYSRKASSSLCVVFPKNGSLIGIVPAEDIWDVGVPFLNTQLETIQEFAELIAYYTQTSFPSTNRIKNMQQLKAAISPDLLDELVKEHTVGDSELREKLKNSRGLDFDVDKVFAYIEKQWHPDLLYFDLIRTRELSSISDDQEVWTDGDCLVIEENFVSQLLDYEQGKKDDEEANV